MVNTEADKARFLEICNTHISRNGFEDLLEWLEKSDFYIAPASTKYHLSEKGGLLRHSLNVYDEMKRLCSTYSHAVRVSEESIAIMALLHDLCKVNFYKPDTRNVKKDGVWTSVPVYTIEEKFCYGGHGSKSVFLAERFIELTPEEAIAINCHMGAWDGNKDVSNAYQHCTPAFLLHIADEIATYITENESNIS